MSANDIVNIISAIGTVLVFLIIIVGFFGDEIAKIIRAIRGDDD